MPRLGNRIYLIVFITLFSTQLFWLSASAQTKTTENQIVSQTDNLAYRIFLMNNNTKAAYDLAKKNVKQHPNNLLWLRRLAKTAGWMGKTREALDLWYELAQKEKSPRLAAKEALKLAIAIRDHTMQERIYRLLIQRGYNNRKNWESLANAQEQQGQTTNAINTLRNLPASLKHPSQQLLIAKIKQQAGQSEQAAAILEQHQQRFGRSFELTLQQAGNSFQRGKINTAYQQLLSVKAKAPATENLYWQMLGDAAWYLQDAKQAAQAYRYLYVNGKIDESRLLRLINATEPNHPKLAFKYATQGWQRYHTRPFIILVLSSGVNSGQYDYIDRFIQQLPTAELTHLKQSNFYWYLRAKLFERQKRYRQAQAVYEQAIRRFPNNLQMKADLLWLLIDTNNKTELAKYLLRWQYMLFKTSLLQPAFAVAYDKLGRPDIAIMLFRRIYQANKMDPIWLLNFADVLERHNDHYAARFLQDRAWQLMAKQYHKNGSVSESNTLSDKAVFANLSPRFLPADNTAQMMAYLSNKRNVEALNAMTTWAIDIEHAELAVAVEQYALHDKIRIPTWSQLSVALLRNDQPKIYTMLKEKKRPVNYRDLVIGAERLRAIRTTQQLAYEGLRDHPNDSIMYRLYREILLQYTDRIYASTLFRQIGSVIGPAFHLGGVYYVTPSLALMPYVRHWIQSLATRQTIARTPDLDQQIGLGLRKLIHNGWMIFIAGGRNNLRTVPQASGAIYYQLQSRWRGGLRVGFDDIADDTTALAVAGMKSGVTGILEYQFTPRDLFLGEVNFNYITGQDYSPLGTGSLIQIAYNHKFWLDFPDWNIGAFGRELIYTRSGRALTPLLRSFVPAGTSPSTALFIPPTQSEIGISFGFNQSLVSDYSFGSRYNRMDFDHVYTYRWRPFGEITALYDDIIGIGYGVLGGIKGSVFGRDQLYFFVNYSRNGTSFDADNITAGVHYEIYL